MQFALDKPSMIISPNKMSSQDFEDIFECHNVWAFVVSL